MNDLLAHRPGQATRSGQGAVDGQLPDLKALIGLMHGLYAAEPAAQPGRPPPQWGRVARLQRALQRLHGLGASVTAMGDLIARFEAIVQAADLNHPPIGLLFGDTLVIAQRTQGHPSVRRQWVGYSDLQVHRWHMSATGLGEGYRQYAAYGWWFDRSGALSVR